MRSKLYLPTLFFLLFLIASCAPQLHYRFLRLPDNSYISSRSYMLDERFTQAEKEKIIEAFKEWEVATHHILSFYYIGEFDHHGIEEFSMRYSTATDYRRLDRLHILKYTPEDMFTYFTSPSDEPNRVIGGTLYYGMFLIPGKLELQTSFKGVAIHEIGHYIGLDHVNSTKMIMCSTCSLANCASDNPVITTEDVELFCSVSNLCAVKVY